MGGINEAVIQPKASSVQKTKVRIHENNGEIHFHDDIAGKKAAIPCSKYFLKWEELQKCPGSSTPIILRDTINKSQVTLQWVEDDNDELDIDVIVSGYSPSFGQTYKALDQLTK